MKRKVEKYLYSKNIGGVHRLKDKNEKYLIGDDIEGCLAAARSGPASLARGTSGNRSAPTPLAVRVRDKTGVTPKAKTDGHSTSSRKKRKFKELFSPAVEPSNEAPVSSVKKPGQAKIPRPSPDDLKEIDDFCRALRGGYDVTNIYRTAVERRKIAENTTKIKGEKLIDVMNNLNLTVMERSKLPEYYTKHYLDHLDEYKAPPPKPSPAKKPHGSPMTYQLGFDDIAAAAVGGGSSANSVAASMTSILLQPAQMGFRPSPVTSKKERESLETIVFDPFSPATRQMTGATVNIVAASSSGDKLAATPERTNKSLSGASADPGSAFSSFSPFISPNYMHAVMAQGMTMTPAITAPDGVAPPSWEQVDAKLLHETFNSEHEFSDGDTPSRKLDALLEASETQRHLSSEEIKDDGIVPTIQPAFSFSDVLSPNQDEALHAAMTSGVALSPMQNAQPAARTVTDSGPLRMRLKSTGHDHSLHHFEHWASPLAAGQTTEIKGKAVADIPTTHVGKSEEYA